MKIKLCLLFLFISLKSFAQKELPLRFGFKVGANISAFTNKDLAPSSANSTNKHEFKNYTRLASLMIGVTGEYSLNTKVSLGAELLYSARGGAYRRKNDDAFQVQNGQFMDAYDFYRYKIDYLELPLIVNYQVYKQNIRVYGGVAPGIFVNGKASLVHAKGAFDGVDTEESEPDSERNLTGEVNTFNLSPLLGVQLGDYYFANKTLLYIDLRMSYALLPVFKSNATINTKMFTGTIGVGLKF